MKPNLNLWKKIILSIIMVLLFLIVNFRFSFSEPLKIEFKQTNGSLILSYLKINLTLDF